jgi:hypothetical protein
MKHRIRLNGLVALGLLVASVAAGQSFEFLEGSFGQNDTHTTLVIKPDGSCVLSNEVIQTRKSLEMALKNWERYSKMSEGISDPGPDDPPPAEPPKTDQKPLTDSELIAKIREMHKERPRIEAADSGNALEVDTVEVSSNRVRLVTRWPFPSLKELLSQTPFTWGPNVLMFEDARAELDTNHNFRLSFTPGQGASQFARNFSSGWKSSKMKFEWKLGLPGKILSSGLPNTEANATWLALDGEKPDTVDAAIKLLGAPLIITAEPAGLKLDEPLESKKLVRAAWKKLKPEPDLPITDAGPGFVAEPVNITLSTAHYFPEGEKHFKDRPETSMFGMSQTGAVVAAKLFPPKGREIRSLGGVRVKSAKDDKGRPIAGASGDAADAESESESINFAMNESEKGGAARFELHLGLPASDAKSIDELQAEAVALTLGSWKEMTLTNLQADAKVEIDLAEVLPGAKLTIKKIGGQGRQKTVELTLSGSKEVSQIDFKLKIGNRRGPESNTNDRRTTTTLNKTTREVTVQRYDFERGADAGAAPTLVVRYPQDLKRERVQFKLTALDLL